ASLVPHPSSLFFCLLHCTAGAGVCQAKGWHGPGIENLTAHRFALTAHLCSNRRECDNMMATPPGAAGRGSMEFDQLADGLLLSGRYDILETVGRGGMGTVYRARDTRLDILVAVKEMHERAAAPEERQAAIQQFEREAKMLAQLSHPNLPRVTDYFSEEGRCY